LCDCFYIWLEFLTKTSND